MPSHNKFARAPLWCALSLALGLAVVSPQADAAGLGRLNVTSGLGQPLRAELEVTSVGRDELPTLQVRMAPLAAFRAANLEFNPALTNLRFALDKRPDGGYFVRITSASPVNEPYLDLMVELTWATGRVIREYTVLLDPPSLRADAPVVPPVAATSTPTAPSVVPPPTTRPSTAPVSSQFAGSELQLRPEHRQLQHGLRAAAAAATAPRATASERRVIRGQVGRHAGRDCGSQQAGLGITRSDAGRNAACQSGRVRCKEHESVEGRCDADDSIGIRSRRAGSARRAARSRRAKCGLRSIQEPVGTGGWLGAGGRDCTAGCSRFGPCDIAGAGQVCAGCAQGRSAEDCSRRAEVRCRDRCRREG